MKKRTILAAMALTLVLTGCTNKPAEPTSAPTQAPTTPTEPAVPQKKTVYVHASITHEYGSTVSRTEYVFDEKDWVTEVIVYTNGTETKRYSVECDENGNFTRWSSDGSQMHYTYDNEGHSLGMSMYLGDQLVSSTTYTWEKDLRTSVTTTTGQSQTQRVLMTYGTDGKLLRQDSYNADTLLNYSIYSYNSDGTTAAMTTYQPDGSLSSMGKYSWDEQVLTILTTYVDGSPAQCAELTYDEAGNLLSHAVFGLDGTLLSKETHTWKAIEVAPDHPRASV